MAATKTVKQEYLSLPELMAEQNRLAQEQKELDERLALARDTAQSKLRDSVQEFNGAFGTSLTLIDGGATTERKPRACSICGQPGHRAKTCPVGPNKPESSQPDGPPQAA